MDVGLHLIPLPKRAARTAQMVEELGFASLIFPDSQNLAPEVWGQLMIAAGATSRIRLGPGVTNSITRDPAVTACAALSLQAESGGRAVLGIGRGDSSVQRIGRAEDPLASFERYLESVQSYLRGDAVDRNGFASRLEWLAEARVPKVPVEVAATGRRVIEAAARRADRICFAVGADAEHLAEALARARAAASAAGRDPGAIAYGAYVNCVVHDDIAAARDALRGAVATFARFSAFRGSDPARLPAALSRTVLYLREHYDMRDHTRTGVAHTAGIDDAFVDWFAIAGPAEVAVARFRALAALGLDFVHVIPGSTGMPRELAIASVTQLARDVLPALGG